MKEVDLYAEKKELPVCLSQVVPGDQLVMTAKFVKRRGTIAVVEAKAEVDGKLAASGTLTFAIGS